MSRVFAITLLSDIKVKQKRLNNICVELFKFRLCWVYCKCFAFAKQKIRIYDVKYFFKVGRFHQKRPQDVLNSWISCKCIKFPNYCLSLWGKAVTFDVCLSIFLFLVCYQIMFRIVVESTLKFLESCLQDMLRLLTRLT